ncbi:MAG TPA: ribosome maturation factor RimP [Methylophilaceae bacterium]
MDIAALLEKTVTQIGYELVDLEMSNRGKMLRLFIDKPEGISVEDCATVSNHVSHLLSVEMDVDYDRLEVSSPGLDRVLKKPADFVRFAGQRVKLKLRIPVEGRKNFVGVLQGMQDDNVVLERDAIVHSFALAGIEKARLDPDFS